MIRQLHKNILLKHFIIYFLMLIIINLISGCNTYRVVTKERIDEYKLSRDTQKGKYFIVHEPDTAWHLAAPQIAINNLLGDEMVLPEWHKSYKLPPIKKGNIYNREDSLESQVINEIHIFTNHVVFIDPSRVIIPIDSITYYQLYNGNKKATQASLGAVLILLSILFFFLIRL